MQKITKWSEKLYLPVVLILSFAASYMLANIMVQIPWTDLGMHTERANLFLDGMLKNSYPGYYLVLGFFSRICGVPQVHAVAVTMGLFYVATGLAVYVIAGFVLGKDASEKTKCLIVLFMNFFGPLYLGGGGYYTGAGSFNAWHNPTNTSVKFWALCSFFIFVYAYQMKSSDTVQIGKWYLKRTHLYAAVVAMTCCSLIFKPSFFQIFAPCLAAVYGLDFLMKKRSFKSCLTDALMFLPAIALIVVQMFVEIGGDESGGMLISFAKGWSYHTDNIFRAIMANAIFLIFVCVFCEKNLLENKMLQFSVLIYIIGVGEGLFLCESGPRISHGNMLWGNQIGIGIGYLGAVLTFVRYMHRTKESPTSGQKAVRYTGNILLAAQFFLGVWYVLRCIVMKMEYF